jgi:hypothetical protein
MRGSRTERGPWLIRPPTPARTRRRPWLSICQGQGPLGRLTSDTLRRMNDSAGERAWPHQSSGGLKSKPGRFQCLKPWPAGQRQQSRQQDHLNRLTRKMLLGTRGARWHRDESATYQARNLRYEPARRAASSSLSLGSMSQDGVISNPMGRCLFPNSRRSTPYGPPPH